MLTTREERLAGLLLGTALGDALGLPAEGLSRRRIARLGWNGRWRHRFLLGRGMVSDDTEHTLLVAESLLRQPDEAAVFARDLAWRLRWWLLAVPAGVGFATLRACLKLWLGWPPERSGIRSAGNGAAMRSAVIGAWFAGDRPKIEAFVRAATILTHTDPRALTGALAIALCAESAMLGHRPADTLATLAAIAPEDQEWQKRLEGIWQGLEEGWSVARYGDHIGCGTGFSGYVYDTVPAAIFAYLKSEDFRPALEEVLDSGGDTDTVGAIAGALLGCRSGASALPREWLDGLVEFPKGSDYLRTLAAKLAGRPVPLSCRRWLLPFRQLLFTATVLAHGFRRLAPPW